MSSNPKICLIGDAILDNYYTLSNKKQDLKKELIDLNFDVYNLAVDEVKVNDVINGIIPSKTYTTTRSYPYDVQKDEKIYPLKSMISILNVNKSFTSVYGDVNVIPISESSKVDSMVVISMGGNDIHSKFKSLLFGVEYFINAVVTKEFMSNYRTVIETAKRNTDKIVLVSIYLPYLGVGSSYGLYSPLAIPVIDKWHKFIYSIAQEYNIPILDLNRTMDVGERSHYGTDDTRVSNETNRCIAECISYIYSHYDAHHIYYAPNIDSSKIIIE